MALLYFIYGLSFFTLGLVLFVRDIPNNLFRMNNSLHFLGAFGFLHAINEWQIMLRINQEFEAWEFIYAPASVTFVSGFSFLILLASGLSGYWVRAHLSDRLLKVIFWIASFLWAGSYAAGLLDIIAFTYADFVGRWFAGGPGAFLVAISLYTMARMKVELVPRDKEKVENTQVSIPGNLAKVFIVASFAIAAYGLFTICGPSIPLFPFSYINQDTFLQIFGFPIQGLRTVAAFVLALAMFISLRQFQYLDKRNLKATISQRTQQLMHSESLLRQSQKMEVVGQLTGGVSHDFNNILGVIQGNAELIEESGELKSEAGKSMLNSILKVTDRGAELTRNLLAFSRKQELKPETVSLDEQVKGAIKILQRTLGETITLKLAIDDDLWKCVVDPGQVDNALLNLAINARDAMPDGGKLTIEIRNATLDDEYAAAQTELEPGEYVMLAVSDTGCGINKEDLQHVFEPFFTTKEVGKGTGLGLSMIYGFVKQSGGHVNVYSEIDSGTTVRLYLPRSSSEVQVKSSESATTLNGDEVVLIVEDDPDMRTLTVALVSSLGYRVREAKDAEAALMSIEKEGPVHLLLTDVILPGGKNGPELADEICGKYPHISTLFMSGYTEQAFLGSNLTDRQSLLLQKPFSRSDLSGKIRKALQ